MTPDKKPTAVNYKRTVINGKSYYGKHLMMTAKSCDERLLEVSVVTAFLKELVNKIDMIAYGEPLVARFGEGIEEGISGVQLITTSALTVHTNDAARDLYLDVFSCKWFDETIVRDTVDAYFAPEACTEQIVLRS
jgi:S-adenosylmethionine/arginine decarboxylase-like enzyme